MRDPSAKRPTLSAAARWAPLARFIIAEERLGRWAEQRPATGCAYEFVRFGIKQAWACLFGAAMVTVITATYLWYPHHAWFARYDFIFLAALAIQAGMLGFRLETLEEAKVILIFHIVGTAMEVFKTGVGSWIYPEPCFFRIAGVPLFSGFMYASIGSYIARVWRLFDFRFAYHPPMWSVYGLAAAIYVNFYAHHYILDLRYLLFAAALLLFGRTRIISALGVPIGTCRCCWLASSTRSLSGSRRTWALSPRRGSILSRWPDGPRYPLASSARGSCC